MMVSFDTNILVYATLSAPLAKTHWSRDLLLRGMRTRSSILLLQTLAEFSSVAIRKAGRGPVDENVDLTLLSIGEIAFCRQVQARDAHARLAVSN